MANLTSRIKELLSLLERELTVKQTSKVFQEISVVYKDSLEKFILTKILDEYLTGQKLKVRSGKLRQSGKTRVELDGIKLKGIIEFGGMSAPYAKIQHDGGTITAKGGGWLTVPLEGIEEARKTLFTPAGRHKGGWTSARDIKDTFIQKSRAGNLIIFQNKSRRGKRGIVPLFVLKKEVTIKPTYYIDDAIKSEGNRTLESVFKVLEKKVDELIRKV